MSERGGIITGIQWLWQWSADYPNGRLAALAIALPVFTLATLIGIEAIVIAIRGHTVSEPVAFAGMFILAGTANLPFVLVPFACWRAFRDYRRRAVNPPAPNSDSTP